MPYPARLNDRQVAPIGGSARVLLICFVTQRDALFRRRRRGSTRAATRGAQMRT